MNDFGAFSAAVASGYKRSSRIYLNADVAPVLISPNTFYEKTFADLNTGNSKAGIMTYRAILLIFRAERRINLHNEMIPDRNALVMLPLVVRSG